MVERWDQLGHGEDINNCPVGSYVLYSDYLALQKALEEALQGWEAWYKNYPDKQEQKRIAQLRSQYLREGIDGSSDRTL